MNLQKMLSGFEEVVKNFDAETINILKRMGDDMIIMQQEHIFEGKRSDDSRIEPEYTNFTIQIKAAKGQPFDRVTLFDKGDFYEAMFFRVEDNKLIFGSDDSKALKLIEKYDKDSELFGLNQDNKKQRNDMLLEKLIDYIETTVNQ